MAKVTKTKHFTLRPEQWVGHIQHRIKASHYRHLKATQEADGKRIFSGLLPGDPVMISRATSRAKTEAQAVK